MGAQKPRLLFLNGNNVPYDDARIHVRSTASKYAATIFEAIGAHHDARASGFQDAILLDQHGKVTEGPGYNLFLVRRGQVITPAATHGILEGVTRDTLIQLFARVHEVRVVEREVDRTELYLASE